MRYVIFLLLLCIAFPAQTFAFLPFFGSAPRDKGVLSKTRLFEPTEGLSVFARDALAVNLKYGAPASGLLWQRATRYDPPLEIEAYRLLEKDGSYRAAPVGSSLDDAEGGRHVVSDLEDLPYQGRPFSVHHSGEGPGRLIVQVEPMQPGGDYEYFLGFAYSFKESPDLSRFLHQTDISTIHAQKSAKEIEGPIEIDAIKGVRIDDKATLLTFFKAYDAKAYKIFGNTRNNTGLSKNLIVSAKTSKAQIKILRMINERACLLMAASPYEHLRATGAGVPKGIERADMRAEEADQACRTALRLGADSQPVRYAAYRAGSEASARAGTRERLPELRADLKALADEGHLAARTDYALLHMGKFGVARDLEKVRALLLSEHERDNPVASFFLGFAIVDGFLPAGDRADGLPYLEAAADGGVDRAYWKIGLHHRQQRSPQGTEAALISFKTGADKREPRSMIALADMYYSGEGVEREPKKAFDLFRKALEQEELVRGVYMMAFMKLHGIGTFQQLSGAREGLEQAVARGYQPAKAALGYMYLSGLGGDRDMETGEAYLTEAAEAGVASAAYYRQRYEAERVEQDASPDTQ